MKKLLFGIVIASILTSIFSCSNASSGYDGEKFQCNMLGLVNTTFEFKGDKCISTMKSDFMGNHKEETKTFSNVVYSDKTITYKAEKSDTLTVLIKTTDGNLMIKDTPFILEKVK